MKLKWEEPMNPNAAEDFAKAVREATDNFSEKARGAGEKMRESFEYMKFNSVGYEAIDDSDESCEPFCGRMRLPYSPIGAWSDMVNILVASGYDVYMEIEQPTETARELDGADKFVVIEYEEVE